MYTAKVAIASSRAPAALTVLLWTVLVLRWMWAEMPPPARDGHPVSLG